MRRNGGRAAAGPHRTRPENAPAGARSALSEQGERVGQALAHSTAGAAVGQLDDIVDRRVQEMMVERHGAELADEDSGITQVGNAADPGKKRARALAET